MRHSFEYRLHSGTGWGISGDMPESIHGELRRIFESTLVPGAIPEAYAMVGHQAIGAEWAVVGKRPEERGYAGVICGTDEFARFDFDPFKILMDADVLDERIFVPELVMNSRQLTLATSRE